MSQSHLNPPSTRSWRDIPQPVRPRAMGREGKKRLVMAVGNIVGLVLVLGAAGWGVFEIIHLWETNPTRITAPTKGVPVRDFAVRTDGVLDKAWVQRTLELPKASSLMELDLVDLKRRLEESGQVSKAVIERKFPDVLVVTLQERTPVSRVMARIGDAVPVAFMVARDGMVYSGFGYDPVMTEALPFIDGVKLVREGSGFVRIEGMDAVADLLGTAQAAVPAIYHSFKIVSLARFGLDRTLVVKSTEVEVITFGSSQDSFYRQLARLDYILGETRRQNATGQLKSVNLAIGDKQVPVSFDTTPDSSAGSRSSTAAVIRPGQTSGTALFSLPPRNSSPTKRDF
ncbi:cell division protein FtsQ/DivIB [Rariglobus hedericola]|uniref:FtsQ-type POTRA domain-containing protein n=1 Tax=Rariglobus hedericola TaxID=2597822 RepID=A0A556QEK8_9BACT|nr:FtsQ-type POTRA domain-containing protein [Rariglobus hedericola]TSJ75068.1 FtsQ-type POTRA domain-containing protein [Rariglobus hedericola]